MTTIATTPPAGVVQTLGFDRPAQVRAALVTAAFVAVFWELLDFIPAQLGTATGTGKLVHMWLTEQDWSHGPLIPAFSAYLVHINWEHIRRCPVRFGWLGLPILLAGLAIYAAAVATVIPFAFAKPMAMMLALLGVIVLLCGVPAMAYLWLPWAYLFFAIPMPKRLYFELTTPLRAMVAWVATKVLTFVPELYIQHHGTVIQYDYRGRTGEIGVVDACSGMRSLIALCAIGVAVAFMTPRPIWQRLILIASCVPIAIFCNFVRVITTCVLHIFVDSKYAEGSYHTALGLVTLALGFVMFSALGWILANLTVPADDSDAPGGTAARA